MAKETANEGGRKYGANNCSVTMEGTDMVIRLDTTVILHAAGTENKAGKERKRNLIATTGGFAVAGSCQVSLNVTS